MEQNMNGGIVKGTKGVAAMGQRNAAKNLKLYLKCTA